MDETSYPQWSGSELWAFLVGRNRATLLEPTWEWADHGSRQYAEQPPRLGAELSARSTLPRPEPVEQYIEKLDQISVNVREAVETYRTYQGKRLGNPSLPKCEPVTSGPHRSAEEEAFNQLRASISGRERACLDLGGILARCESGPLGEMPSQARALKRAARQAGFSKDLLEDVFSLLGACDHARPGRTLLAKVQELQRCLQELDEQLGEHVERLSSSRHAEPAPQELEERVSSTAPGTAKEGRSADSLVRAEHREGGSQILRKSVKLAYLSYQHAMERIESVNPTDDEVYEWLKERSGPDEYRPPSCETWKRYVRIARKHYGKQKNRPRPSRPHGRSIVSQKDI